MKKIINLKLKNKTGIPTAKSLYETEWRRGDTLTCTSLSGGYDNDEQLADEYLTLNKKYTISWVGVSGWNTDVELVEIPGVLFNSVFFTNFK